MPIEVVPEIRELVGDALRAVATYDADSFDDLYRREGIDPDGETIERIHEELVLQGLGVGYLEDVFGVGELNCSIHRFEEAMIFHFTNPDLTGLFVSVDADADVAVPAFAERCNDLAAQRRSGSTGDGGE